MPAAKAIRIGWKIIWNWGTPKSNSAWKVESPISKPPISDDPAHVAERRGVACCSSRFGRALTPLDHQHGHPDQGQRRAADQHQVGRAPERHVLPEQPVPEVVERKAEQGEARGGNHQHAAERRVPAAVDAHGGVRGPLPRQRHRDEAGAEDPEQPAEDQVVGGVGRAARGPGRRRCAGRCPSTSRAARPAGTPTRSRTAAPPSRADPSGVRRPPRPAQGRAVGPSGAPAPARAARRWRRSPSRWRSGSGRSRLLRQAWRRRGKVWSHAAARGHAANVRMYHQMMEHIHM